MHAEKWHFFFLQKVQTVEKNLIDQSSLNSNKWLFDNINIETFAVFAIRETCITYAREIFL